jgi:hypothetical protein
MPPCRRRIFVGLKAESYRAKFRRLAAAEGTWLEASLPVLKGRSQSNAAAKSSVTHTYLSSE